MPVKRKRYSEEKIITNYLITDYQFNVWGRKPSKVCAGKCVSESLRVVRCGCGRVARRMCEKNYVNEEMFARRKPSKVCAGKCGSASLRVVRCGCGRVARRLREKKCVNEAMFVNSPDCSGYPAGNKRFIHNKLAKRNSERREQCF